METLTPAPACRHTRLQITTRQPGEFVDMTDRLQALVTEAILEAARDGKSVADCMELGKKVVTVDECMPGVRERITLLQVEATFPDGTKLVSCHDPIAG